MRRYAWQTGNHSHTVFSSVTGDPPNALEVVFTTIYMSAAAAAVVVDDTQAALPTRLQTVTGESHTSPAAAKPEGHRAVWTAWRGELLARLSLKRADVNVKIWKRGGHYVHPDPLFLVGPGLVFCWWCVLMAKSPSVWFT